jgi:hypothetical protein
MKLVLLTKHAILLSTDSTIATGFQFTFTLHLFNASSDAVPIRLRDFNNINKFDQSGKHDRQSNYNA